MLSAVEAQSLNQQTARAVPELRLLKTVELALPCLAVFAPKNKTHCVSARMSVTVGCTEPGHTKMSEQPRLQKALNEAQLNARKHDTGDSCLGCRLLAAHAG